MFKKAYRYDDEGGLGDADYLKKYKGALWIKEMMSSFPAGKISFTIDFFPLKEACQLGPERLKIQIGRLSRKGLNFLEHGGCQKM